MNNGAAQFVCLAACACSVQQERHVLPQIQLQHATAPCQELQLGCRLMKSIASSWRRRKRSTLRHNTTDSSQEILQQTTILILISELRKQEQEMLYHNQMLHDKQYDLHQKPSSPGLSVLLASASASALADMTISDTIPCMDQQNQN